MHPGRVAIVGGGLAGLAAALELKNAGATIDLFERSRLLGGKATSFTTAGHEVDNGQHVFLGCCTEFIDFLTKLGFPPAPADERGSVYLQPRFQATVLGRGGALRTLRAAPLPPPLHLAPVLLRYPDLSLRSKLEIARAILVARRPAHPNDSFADWLDRHGQSADTRTAFWDPFFVPALNATLDRVSAEAGLFVLTTAFLSSTRAACFGFATMPLARIAEAGADRLDKVYLRTPVVAVEGTTIVVADERRDYDAVVLAVPPARLASILARSADLGIRGLERFQPAPIVDVHLWYDVETFGFGFAALPASPVQWVFEKGPGYLCCSMSAAEHHVSTPVPELIELCRNELARLLPPVARASFLEGAATRDRDATFVPEPGLPRPRPATHHPGVVIAGAWTDTGWPATMESAVRSGRAAARTLIARMENAPHAG